MFDDKTTTIGYVNCNRQVVIRSTALPGTDHGQTVCQLACSFCGLTYGANDSDVFERKCPKCQNAKPGLDFEASVAPKIPTAPKPSTPTIETAPSVEFAGMRRSVMSGAECVEFAKRIANAVSQSFPQPEWV